MIDDFAFTFLSSHTARRPTALAMTGSPSTFDDAPAIDEAASRSTAWEDEAPELGGGCAGWREERLRALRSGRAFCARLLGLFRCCRFTARVLARQDANVDCARIRD